jgi:hypothetical protein
MMNPYNSSTSSAALVTPERQLAQYCPERKRGGDCGCVEAKLQQFCQSCRSYVRVGDCISHKGFGWVHSHCEDDDNRGLPVLS